MAKKETMSLGGWAFFIGFALAVLFGIVGVKSEIAWLLIVLGLVIGFLNITEKEVQPFLMGGTVLVIVSALGADAMAIIPVVGNVLNAMLLLFIPATVIVAIKSVFYLIKE